MRLKAILVVSFIFLNVFFVLGIHNRSADVHTQRDGGFRISDDYTPHDRIEIIGDDDFATMAATESWPGSGTEEEPYVISGYHIVEYVFQPVRIFDTTVHWEVSGNLFSTEDNMCGFLLENTTNGVIRDNVFNRVHSGLYLEEVYDLEIKNNHFIDNWGNGVEINIGSNVNVTDNIIEESDLDGIVFFAMDNCIISGNTITNNSYSGINLDSDTKSVIVENNNISHGLKGIQCSAQSCTFKNNIIYDVQQAGFQYFTSSSASHYSEDNVMMNNTIIDCGSYGVKVQGEDSNNITVMYNDFFESQADCILACEGSLCVFDSNFYDTHCTPDVNHDGYVDIPYSVESELTLEDTHPLSSPSNPIPDWYEYIPPTQTSTSTSATISSSTTPDETTTSTSSSEPTTPVDGGYVMDPIIIGIGATAAVVVVLVVVLAMRKR